MVSGLLENTVITPRIIGNKVGLPPLAVLLAVLGFGELFGFVGMLLAVPAAAVIKVLILHARHGYWASAGYGAPVPARAGTGPPQRAERSRRPRRRYPKRPPPRPPQA